MMKDTKSRQPRRSRRRGAITVIAALSAIVLLGMVAFAIDLGYVMSAKEELQRSADAAALAACWEYGQGLADGNSESDAAGLARPQAVTVAAANMVTNQAPVVDANTCNATDGGVVFGYIDDLYSPTATLDTTDVTAFNSAKVVLRRGDSLNAKVPLFFAAVFGHTAMSLQAEATASIIRDVQGFKPPNDGSGLGILPIALDNDSWNDLLAGTAVDDWTWDADTGQVTSGPDGVLEVNLYPQGTGAPGNRGMVDIGSNNNSTSDIARQILDGISAADLAHHGGELKLDANGELFLNGDTGISAGIKDELEQVKGEPKTIPIFTEVNGPGNNAMYTIVKWAGVRIMYVKLTGPMNNKQVMVQPAAIVSRGIIPSPTTGTSDFVFSRVVLVR